MTKTAPIRVETMHRVGGSLRVVSLEDHQAALLQALKERDEALREVREKLETLAAKWRAQCKVLETGQPTFGDGLAASREECARNLDFLAASLAKDAPVSFGSPKCPKCTHNMWAHPNPECSGDITS